MNVCHTLVDTCWFLKHCSCFPPRSKWKGQGRGVLYIEVLPDFILSLQYCANVLDMDQQCSKRSLNQLNIGSTHPLLSSSFFIYLFFFQKVLNWVASLIVAPVSNKLLSAAAKYFPSWLFGPEHLLPFFWPPVVCFFGLLEKSFNTSPCRLKLRCAYETDDQEHLFGIIFWSYTQCNVIWVISVTNHSLLLPLKSLFMPFFFMLS